jgi:hypothetical protein
VVSVNNDEVLRQNLLLSPGLLDGGRNQLIIRQDYPSASIAYNSALDEAQHDILIFVHQDVYLPDTWFADLKRCLAYLDARGARWGVLGCFGTRKGTQGGLGRVYSRGVGRDGRLLDRPEPVETLDEIVLIIRKSSGLRFDANLPHFHLYGTDICMTALDRGMANYAFQGFCVHNTNQLLILPEEFYACYRYIRRKWSHYLPIHTSCIRITRLNKELHWRRFYEARQRMFGVSSPAAQRVEDPRVFSGERD